LSPTDRRERLVREAIRLLDRYHVEIVERFGLCPWAKQARATGRTQTLVAVDESDEATELAPALRALADDPSVDAVFVVAPRFDRGLGALERWGAALAASTDDRFVSAPFHPGARGSTGSVRFFRQTPDPTIQLVRRGAVEAMRAQDPPHYRDIFTVQVRELDGGQVPKAVAALVIEHNERTLREAGKTVIQSIIDDIRADRMRTYASLLP